MTTMFFSTPRRKVLLVCLRRLGDVLLATPLSNSLKSASQDTQVDWLVFAGSEGPLQFNPAADNIYTLQPKASLGETFQLLRKIFQKYDLAISTQPGDRPSYIARFAARRAITFASSSRGGRLRDWLFSEVVFNKKAHRVEQLLCLLTPLAVRPRSEIIPPSPSFNFASSRLTVPYVVLHPGAAFEYKKWTESGWRGLAHRLLERGLHVVVTGGSSQSEKAYLDKIFDGMNLTRTDGLLSWPELAGVLYRASYFIGVDTSVTHLAASCNVSGAAIFGPTDPLLWGPYSQAGTARIRLIQRGLPCQPCQQEGCEKHLKSRSLCLDLLDLNTVWRKIESDLFGKREGLKSLEL